MNKQVWAMPIWINDQYYLRMTTGDSVAWLGNLDKSKPVRLDPKQPRSGGHHRKYWAILSKVAENCDQYRNGEELHEAILFQMGKVTKRIVVMPSGEWEVTFDRDSTAFAKMDQAEFQAYYDEAMIMIESMGFCIADIMAEITKEFGK